MNRKHRLTAIGATTAGLLGVVSLTGAASASAATMPAPAPSGQHISAPPSPSTTAATPPTTPSAPNPGPAPAPAPAPAPRSGPVRHSWTLAKVRAAVLAKYPNVTINRIAASNDGWTVSVTTAKGHPGIVRVNSDFSVGRLMLAQRYFAG